MSKEWSNLAKVVALRTYSRPTSSGVESWSQVVERAISGNVKGFNVPEKEVKELIRLANERKAGPAGRGYWFSGTEAHSRIGGSATCNCWFLNSSEWNNYVIAADLLMLGGGVGLSVEHKYSSKLPKIKADVHVVHKATKDADYIVPDSREGWCELISRVLESWFVTGKSFSYSTICLRGYGEPIKGFGGVASGPLPLVEFVETVNKIMAPRQRKFLRPLDAADIITAIGQMVVSGNVRRSAIIILGDCWDKEYLKAKRWDLGDIPAHRGRANYSVVCDDIEDVHPLFWKTYEHGEPFGIINRTNIQKYGRMGELQKDTAEGVNPCVPGYTEILTDTGYKSIESVVGKWTNVWNGKEWSAVMPRITGRDQLLVKVTFSSGQTLVCTPSHEFIVSTDYRGGITKTKAKDLVNGTPLAKFKMPIVAAGKLYENAYLQGFVSAEGMDGYSYVSVYTPKQMCMHRLNSRYESQPSPDGKKIRCYFPKEVLPKIFVPNCEWDISSRLNWFAGLLDGDGTVLKEGGTQIASVDENFLLLTQKMLTTLGINSKVSLSTEAQDKLLPDGKGGSKLYPCAAIYRLLIGSVEMQELISLGLHCERLKLEGFCPQRNAGRFVTVSSVEDYGKADVVYCFTDPKNGTGCFEGVVTGQCGEATLENGEPCNLMEMALCNFDNEKEFVDASRLMMRYGKRVCLNKYHHEVSDEVIKRNMRVGIGITGCLSSKLFESSCLDTAYSAILDEDKIYSKELGTPLSIRHTVVKPSGTMGKVLDCEGEEGIHAALAPYIIQRVQFSANDRLVPILRAAGHPIEPKVELDGTFDSRTVVVSFFVAAPDGAPTVETGWNTWKQLDVVKKAQKHWSDQAVSVTVYYQAEEIPKLKTWLSDNLKEIKTISFLKYSGHGFKQAPKEPITREQYEKAISKITPIEESMVGSGDLKSSMECEGGFCPTK